MYERKTEEQLRGAELWLQWEAIYMGETGKAKILLEG